VEITSPGVPGGRRGLGRPIPSPSSPLNG
jgi:hypothetical protein